MPGLDSLTYVTRACRVRAALVGRYSAVLGLITCAGLVAAGCVAARSAGMAKGDARGSALTVPIELPRSLAPKARVAGDLLNPRGILPLADGSLLVAAAGTGDPEDPFTGSLLRLHDADGDGRYDGAGERTVLLDKQPSANILDIVRRDEVFGMAAVAEGDGTILVSVAFFLGPSTIFRVEDGDLSHWATVHGNINSLDYDIGRGAWLGISSSADEIVWLRPGRGAERIVKIPPLAGGQDPVPGYVRYEPRTGAALVTLFSGSTRGEEGGEGTELEARAGGIVRVHPDSGATEWIVTGLTAPTDLVVAPDGRLYVLEFCDGFADPLGTREALHEGTSHGGFTRYSGRLLRIDLDARTVDVLAEGLDGPTNLGLAGSSIFITEGMGTPGRSIPGPDGPVALEGFIEKVSLPAPSS